MPTVDSITIRGYKSIKALENFELLSLNVLIGANGSGKSNFISIFEMLSALIDGRLQLFVQENDGPDSLLFRTRKHTQQVDAEFYFAQDASLAESVYALGLQPAGDRLVFASESASTTTSDGDANRYSLGSGHTETRLPQVEDHVFTPYIKPTIAHWRVYHFNDTTLSARARQKQTLRDDLYLKSDGGNIAPFLRLLREQYPDHDRRIVEAVRMVAPFFGDFVYRKDAGERVELEWFQAGDPDTPYGPRQLSDGTLRFICLAALLCSRPTFNRTRF